MSERPTSSISLVSSVASDSDYHSCVDEMPSGLEQSLEFPSDGSEFEEPVLPLEDDYWQSTVQIYSVPLLPSPPFPFFFPCSVDQSIQSDEHEPNCPHDGATLVVWDSNLPNSFQPASHTSILLSWWHSSVCYSTFCGAAYTKLSESETIEGDFKIEDLQSDDMEGQPIWNPLTLEMSEQWQQRLDCVQLRRLAIIDEAVEHVRAATAEAAREVAEVADTETAGFLSDDFSDSDEDFWEPAPFRTPLVAVYVPLLPPGSE